MFITASDDRSPWGNFWFQPVANRTTTGVRISPESSMRLSAVYACVRVLSETLAVLPFCLYQKNANGGHTEVTDHWLYRLLAKRPNRYQNAFEWREMMQGHLALRGNAYNRITSNSIGEITELMPINPDAVRIEVLPTGEYRYRIKQSNGTEQILARGDVWHLRGLSSDGIVGLSPIDVARETIGLGLSAQEYGARFFQNDARPGGGWIEHPGQFKDKTARDNFRESYQNAQSGSNRHKTTVLEGGMKYHELAIKNNDAQFLETRQFQVTDIARIYRVPPHLIGDLSRATFTNIEQQSLEFVNYTMTPWAERWEASIEADLLLDDDSLEVELDFENLLRGDQVARSTFYASGINSGWMTRNEARLRENLNPIDGLDEPLLPLNMVEEGQQQGATPPVAPDARLAALASAAAERIARKEVEMARMYKDEKLTAAYDKHASFIAQALNISADASKAYCNEQLAGCMSNPGMLAEQFEEIARCKLERLALGVN